MGGSTTTTFLGPGDDAIGLGESSGELSFSSGDVASDPRLRLEARRNACRVELFPIGIRGTTIERG